MTYRVLYADGSYVFRDVVEETLYWMPEISCDIAATANRAATFLDENRYDLVISAGDKESEMHKALFNHPRKPAAHVVLLNEEIPPIAAPGAAVLNRWLMGFEAIVTRVRNGDWQALAPRKPAPRPPLPAVVVDTTPPPRLRVLYMGHKDHFDMQPDRRQEQGSTLIKCVRLYHVCPDIRLDFTATAEDATRMTREGGAYDLIFAEHGLTPPECAGTAVHSLDPHAAEESFQKVRQTIDARRAARHPEPV